MTNSIDSRLERLQLAHKNAKRQQYYWGERGTRMEREREGWRRYTKQLEERRHSYLLFEVGRNQQSVREIFYGLAERYADACLSGRLETWGRTVKANLDFIMDDKEQFKIQKRADFA